jgi:dihydrolipoamide dehydrogenase
VTKKISFDFDTIIVGSGPAGSTAAEILTASGQRVAIIESADTFGGECLNYGCIPTKSMLSVTNYLNGLKTKKTIDGLSLVKLKISKLVKLAEDSVGRAGVNNLGRLFSNLGIKTISGRAYLVNQNILDVNGSIYTAKNIVIATGGEPKIPNIPGLAESDYLTYKTFIAGVKLKAPKKVIIIGGGAVGCEYAQILNACGISVTILEAMPDVLSGQEPEASKLIHWALAESKIKVHTSIRIESVTTNPSSKFKQVHFINKDGTRAKESADTLLVATGKALSLRDGLDNIPLELEHGFIKTNSFCQTSAGNIYAIGDAAGPFRLTSTALQQARVAANNILAKSKKDLLQADYDHVPSCVFTNPEVALIGTPTLSLNQQGIKYLAKTLDFSELTKSTVDPSVKGFLKIWIDPKKRLILGACMAGGPAAELISIISLAMQTHLSIDQLAKINTVFPTVSESTRILAAEF